MKYLFEFRQFSLTEGGNAFSDTESIPRERVEDIFVKFKAAVATIFGRQTEPELIGSWRQKPVSGDLDALFHSDLELDEISKRLGEAGYEAKIFQGFNIVSVNFEFEPGKRAQIDLFVRPLGDSKEMTDLFYKSPNNEEYSTKHRVFLIFAALDSMKFDQIEQGGKLKSFKGYMLRPDGLYEFTKEMKRINFAITDRRKVTDEVDQISEVLFGRVYPYKLWNTYKGTLSLLKQNPALDMQLILSNYRQKLEQEGLRIPEGIS